jgi:putative endonuclease
MFPLRIFRGKASEKGKVAEDYAVKYLKSKGYKILARNYRKPFGEIDVICKKDGCLVFVEIRSLSGDFMEPCETITYKKRENLLKVAESYLSETGWCGDVRFDFLGLKWVSRGFQVDHIENFLEFS